MTYEEARRKADATGGHIVVVHRAESYDYDVKPGPEPRAWPEPGAKK